MEQATLLMLRFVLAGAVLLAAVFCGCGRDGYAELGLVDVQGTVTLDGQPLPGAKVSFEGPDKRAAIGVTDESGKYRLMYDSQTPGATPGPKTVRITTGDVDVEGGGAGEGAAPVKEKLPARYNRSSELKVEVSAGGGSTGQMHNFDLKSSP
jgi:hypothetical protein